jgi:FixJ family two-component response regulator
VTKPVVYVVDDDESMCKALDRLMRSAGLEVRTFTSPMAFLNEGCQDVPGCLVLDMRMPGMGGLELQERLNASGCRMPIIFISAHEDEQTRACAMKRGAVAFLHKPFDDQILLDAIYPFLRGPEMAGQQNSSKRDARHRQSDLIDPIRPRGADLHSLCVSACWKGGDRECDADCLFR